VSFLNICDLDLELLGYPSGSHPHIAFLGTKGTAWTGLALMSRTTATDPVWSGANPMQLSGRLPADDFYCLPQQQEPDSSITDKACMWK
jgi:hypothetical protein